MVSKKILALTFYEDFSRFFYALNKHNEQNLDIDLFSTHLSGYIYNENNFKLNKVFLPYAIRKINPECSIAIDDDKLKWIAEYNIKFGLKRKRALQIAYKYFQFYCKQLIDKDYDCCIISGDSRMQSRALSLACDLLEVPKLFFEQAPFGSTLFDPKGVNCNASVRHRPDIKERAEAVKINFSKNKAWKPILRLRIIDYIFSSISFGALYPEIVEEKSISNIVNRQLNSLKNTESDSNYSSKKNILVIGQVPTDANMLMHSNFANHTDLILASMSLKANNIVFREHPLYRGCYEKTLYETIANNDRLQLSCHKSLDSDLENADKIIVINSTVGMEAILKYRRNVLVYGQSIYDLLFGVYKPEQITEFESAPPCYENSLLQHNLAWFDKHFIRGHFRDDDLTDLARFLGIKINDI